MKKLVEFFGLMFVLIAIILVFNLFSNITGLVILENFPALWNKILIPFFVFIGVLFILIATRKAEKSTEGLEERLSVESVEGIRTERAEEKRNYGRNIELHAVFMRHGEKGAEGMLSEKGKEQARTYGTSLEKKTAIKGYSNNVSRVIESVKEVLDSAPHDKKLNLRIRGELAVPPLSKKFAVEFESRFKQDPDATADWYFDMGSKRYDKDTVSAQEIAESFAYMVKNYIEMSKRLYAGSKVDLINGTHQMLPEALLKEILIRKEDGRVVRGFKSVKEIGGLLSPSEAMDFVILRDNSGNEAVKLSFRGKMYDIDMDRLNQLADDYEAKKPRYHKEKH